MDEEWSADGRNIISTDRLLAVRNELENEGPIILEHWFYYGSCAPDRFVFDDYDEFVEYLTTHAKPGDALHIWSFSKACLNENTMVDGKYPDAEGRVPKGGAY